ncbi:UNVERIFIED_CONTAM: hypothetical protein HDU68_000380 [Siphonaria sp. JEL0065]|nr:hypothetical protein HDU68_000380 [Siphonaria sp. JEL0065]
MSVSVEKYSSVKRKLREVLVENEFLASKLWKFKTRLLEIERERELSCRSCMDIMSNVLITNSNLLHKLKKSGLANVKSTEDVISEDESVAGATQTPAAAAPPAAPVGTKKEGKETRKRRPVTSKTNKIQPYPTNESGGPILPLTSGVMTILELGEIVHDRIAYHTERYIYPVGFKSLRSFFSVLDAEKQVNYTCEVLDGGDAPKFVVTPEDCPDRAVEAASLTGAWTPLFKAAYALRNRDHASGLSGPEFFGFTQGIVTKVIQELPNARLCKNYVWQEFQFIKPRKRGVKSEEGLSKKVRVLNESASSTSLETIPTTSLDHLAAKPAPERRSSRYDDDDLDGDDDDDMDAEDEQRGVPILHSVMPNEALEATSQSSAPPSYMQHPQHPQQAQYQQMQYTPSFQANSTPKADRQPPQHLQHPPYHIIQQGSNCEDQYQQYQHHIQPQPQAQQQMAANMTNLSESNTKMSDQ